MLLEKAPLDLEVRKSAISPASRARCLKPYSARPPVVVLFRLPILSSVQRSDCRSLTTAAGGLCGARAWDGSGQQLTPGESPVARRLARRERSASAIATRVCVLASFRRHRPRSALSSASRSARLDRDVTITRQSKVSEQRTVSTSWTPSLPTSCNTGSTTHLTATWMATTSVMRDFPHRGSCRPSPAMWACRSSDDLKYRLPQATARQRVCKGSVALRPNRKTLGSATLEFVPAGPIRSEHKVMKRDMDFIRESART